MIRIFPTVRCVPTPRAIVFAATAAAIVFCAVTARAAAPGELGRRFPPEKTVVADKTTGREITFLTHSRFNDVKPYQTHDTWTADGRWIVFSSNRSENGQAIFLVNENSGEIVQVTNEKIIGSTINLSRKTMTLYYARCVGNTDESEQEIVEANLAKILADSETGKFGPDSDYRRVVARLAKNSAVSGFALDADESTLYAGIVHRDANGKLPAVKEETTSELDAVDIKTGTVRAVLPRIPFRIGHVQANPKVPGEIAYCHETGGDAPLRIWLVRADGSDNRPGYRESPEEWVTHETFSGPDEMMFILSANSPPCRVKPSGIAVVDLRTKMVMLLGQTALKDGLFWHCNGSPDGRLAVGDTHAGKLYLIDRSNGQRTLLSAGHPQRPNHLHPIFSPDGKRILIQTGLANGGKSLDLATIPVSEK